MDYLVAVLLCTHCQNMFALYATHFKSKYLCFKLYFKWSMTTNYFLNWIFEMKWNEMKHSSPMKKIIKLQYQHQVIGHWFHNVFKVYIQCYLKFNFRCSDVQSTWRFRPFLVMTESWEVKSRHLLKVWIWMIIISFIPSACYTLIKEAFI